MEEQPTRRERKLNHLLPLHYTPLVVQEHGSFRALEMLDAPLDAFGLPDASSTLRLIGRHIMYDDELESYLEERQSNVHHLAHSKSKYFFNGKRSVQMRLRESPLLKVEMKVPIHNLDHIIMLEPKIAPKESMIQHTAEVDAARRLYRVGSAVLWLDEMSGHGTQTYRTAQDYFMRTGFRGDGLGTIFLPSYSTFLDELSHVKDGVMGILPDRERLANSPLEQAVAMLAKVATSEAMTSQEESTAVILQASKDEYDEAA